MKKDVLGRQCLTIIMYPLITPALAGGFFTTSTMWEAHEELIKQLYRGVGKVVPGRVKSA